MKNVLLIDDTPEFLAQFFTEDIYNVQPSAAGTPAPVIAKPTAPATGLAAKANLQSPAKQQPQVKVLVSYPNRTEIPSKDKKFLVQILSAVNLDMRQVEMVNIAKLEGYTFEEAAGDDQQVLTFGLGRSQLPEVITKPGHYNVEEKELLCVWDLASIAQDVKKKGLLWKHLKQMFKIK